MRSVRAGETVRINVDLALLPALQEAALDTSPVSIGPRRTATPHEFYRYPARFSPALARAAIEAFSRPGDLVADPFVGGGTALVEARLAGRAAWGADINQLATFVSRVKTRIYSDADLEEVRRWLAQFSDGLSPSTVTWPVEPDGMAYFINFDGEDVEELRSALLAAITSLSAISSKHAADLARCIVLRTAQWALDMRQELPSAEALRAALIQHAEATVEAAELAATDYLTADEDADNDGHPRTLVLDQALPGLAQHPALCDYKPPRLVLTSPPYPGVYVNYHRWKVRGRLETPLPYFIAGQNDGNGLAYYTMHARSTRSRDRYFERLEEAFVDLSELCDANTWLVQVVGFSNIDDHLARYLRTMDSAGWSEYTFDTVATDDDGRLWRDVPGRRWWTKTTTRTDVASHTAREVVLFHKLAG